MNRSTKRSALSLAALALFIATPVITPAYAAPVVIDTIEFAEGVKPVAVAVSPSGKKAYVANIYGDNVSVINVATGNVSKTIELPADSWPCSVVFSPNGKRAYVANTNGRTISVITVATDTVKFTIGGLDQHLGSVKLSPNGKKLYVTMPNTRTVAVIDPASGAVTATIELAVDSYPEAMAISPNGKKRMSQTSETTPFRCSTLSPTR